jgi:hypothetical protein
LSPERRWVGKNIVAPEAHYAPAAARQPCRATFISDAIGMLSAIGFDYQSMFDAGEIGDERAEGMLAAELVALEPAPA